MTATAIGSYATTAALKALIGTTDSDDDAELGLICDRVNQLIESMTMQPVCPISSATYLYDVADTTRHRSGVTPLVPWFYGIGSGMSRLFTPAPVDAATKGIGGLRAITLLEIAPYSGGTYATVAATDYFLRERQGVSGPYKWLVLSDRPAGVYSHFPVGRATVRVTATAGWAAIPDDLTETALAVAHRAWNAREIGQQDVSGSDEHGRPIVARFLAGRDKETIARYTLKWPY